MGKKKSIVTQTVLRVSCVFVIVLVLLVLSFTWFISTYMRQNILENQQEQIEIVTDSLESRMQGLLEMAVSLAKYQPVISWLNKYYEPYSVEWMENKRNLDSYLQNVNLFTEYIVDINLLYADYETAYSLRDVLRSDYSYAEQDWFNEALKKTDVIKYAAPHGNDHLYNSNMKETFSLICSVYHSDRLLGYEVIECNLFGIADFLDEGNERESRYILLDEQNKIIFGDNNEPMEALISVLDEVDSGKENIYEKNGSIFIAYRLKQNNWAVILESDEGVLWKPIKRLFLVVGYLAVLTVCFLLGINLYNIKIMEKPFQVLINRINSYDGTDAGSVEEYSEAPHEIAVIGARFEDMAGKVNSLINDVYIAQLKQKDAELEALINQINPHFLYNVFQLIQTKAVLSGNQEIEDMIQALSMMMRYSMERKRDRVYVRAELDYIRNYFMFYKERFPELFVYEVNGEEAAAEYRMIKFILQPVIENCFKHAFKNRKNGGVIKIDIREAEEDLIFEVWDNGCGIPENALKQIQQKLDGASYEGGIGIVNTNARIRLVYGSQYGIRMESELNEYTKVTLRIKKEGQ